MINAVFSTILCNCRDLITAVPQLLSLANLIAQHSVKLLRCVIQRIQFYLLAENVFTV